MSNEQSNTITQRCVCLGDWGADPHCKICSGVGTIEVPAPAYVLVPREPTSEMEHDGALAHDHPSVYMGGPSFAGRQKAVRIYRAMIAAYTPAPVDDVLGKAIILRSIADEGYMIHCMSWAAIAKACRDGADLIASLQARVQSLTASLKWVDEVYPAPLTSGGAEVHMTWEEYNAMRVALGLEPRPFRRGKARAALKDTTHD